MSKVEPEPADPRLDVYSDELLTRSQAIAFLMESAHQEGHARRRRVRVATYCVGTVLIALGVVGAVLCFDTVPYVFHATVLAGVSALLLSVLPTERRLVVTVCVLTLLIECAVVVAMSLVAAMHTVPTACGELRALPCGFMLEGRSFLLFAISWTIGMLSPVVVALRLGWLLARSRSSRHLLEAVWRAFSLSALAIAVRSVLWQIWIIDTEGRPFVNPQKPSIMLVTVATVCSLGIFLAVGSLGILPDLRQSVVGWLASNNAASSSASQMAQLMGGGSAEGMMQHAKKLLRSVAFNVLHPGDFESDAIPHDARERTRAAHIGAIDAFVSHSWKADPAAMWAALEGWAGEFKEQHGRWPLLWIDRLCVDQSQLGASVACLPVFISSCDTLLVLYDETFLSRLWCVVELFAHLVISARVGGTLVVRRLPSAGCASGGPVTFTSSALTPLETDAIRVRLRSFDVRLAECTVPDDRELLLDLIDAYPGGIANFNRDVGTIFCEQAFVHEQRAVEHSLQLRQRARF